MAKITAKEFKDRIQKYMELNFGSDLKTGSKRQVYQAVLGVTNNILAEKKYPEFVKAYLCYAKNGGIVNV